MRKVDLSDTHLVVTGLWGARWNYHAKGHVDLVAFQALGLECPAAADALHPLRRSAGRDRREGLSMWSGLCWASEGNAAWRRPGTRKKGAWARAVRTAARGLALVRLEELAQHAAAAVRSHAEP